MNHNSIYVYVYNYIFFIIYFFLKILSCLLFFFINATAPLHANNK